MTTQRQLLRSIQSWLVPAWRQLSRLGAWLAIALALAPPASAQTHPLDPLTANELSAVIAALKTSGSFKEGHLFPEITLREPPKSEVLAWRPGQPFRREALAVVLDLPANRLHEAVIDLRANRVLSWQHVPSSQPLLTGVENDAAITLTRASPDWRAAMRRRGLTNFLEIALTPWAPGHLPLPGSKNARLYRVLSYHQGKQQNSYGPPIEGVETLVDLNQKKVIQVLDSRVRPVPQVSTDYFDPAVRGTTRAPLKPLHVAQPAGASVAIHDQEVSWDRWRFRFGFNVREGLVLYQVRYEDAGQWRSILYRASVSEMLVPYGDPDSSWVWRNAFDEGEYGLGKLAAPLVPGQNTAPHARLLSPVVAGDLGETVTLTNRVDLFERPGAGLWSHWEYVAGTAGRRNRELWVGFTATIGNYDYTFHWIFRPDASLELRAELNGILLMKGVDSARCQSCERPASGEPADQDDRYGTLVAAHIVAPNHQHFFNVRLDFDVDGVSNSVKEINVESPKNRRKNPHRNAMVAKQTVFTRESQSARHINPATARTWAIFNPNRKTELGHYPAYWLHPHGNALPFLGPDTEVRRVAGFLDQHFAATLERTGELFSGGKYPTQSLRYENLRDWIRDDEAIANQDVVVWYTVGVTHVPRPEDFPIMPSVSAGFTLLPKGYFNRNPALDVPDCDTTNGK
jgi:primary-amine oxidase